jgi:hypothetical protein
MDYEESYEELWDILGMNSLAVQKPGQKLELKKQKGIQLVSCEHFDLHQLSVSESTEPIISEQMQEQ